MSILGMKVRFGENEGQGAIFETNITNLLIVENVRFGESRLSAIATTGRLRAYIRGFPFRMGDGGYFVVEEKNSSCWDSNPESYA